jgi:hypothetical protein
MPFQLESNYPPRGYQAQAIATLPKPIEAGNRHQTLRHKTFTIANVIRELDRSALITDSPPPAQQLRLQHRSRAHADRPPREPDAIRRVIAWPRKSSNRR